MPMNLVRNRVLHVNNGILIGGAGEGSLIRDNRVRSSGDAGLFIDNMANSTIENNLVKGGEGDGIVLGGDFGFPGVGPDGNAIQNNDFRNNAGTDCIDETVPPDNNWDAETNLGDDANQEDICTPGIVGP
jgi:parallel beta-helix repeat protein